MWCKELWNVTCCRIDGETRQKVLESKADVLDFLSKDHGTVLAVFNVSPKGKVEYYQAVVNQFRLELVPVLDRAEDSGNTGGH